MPTQQRALVEETMKPNTIVLPEPKPLSHLRHQTYHHRPIQMPNTCHRQGPSSNKPSLCIDLDQTSQSHKADPPTHLPKPQDPHSAVNKAPGKRDLRPRQGENRLTHQPLIHRRSSPPIPLTPDEIKRV